MKNKPDDRSDNVEKIQYHIDSTIENIRRADEMIDKTNDKKAKEQLQEKNKRREASLEGMRHEIRDEAQNQEVQKHDE